MLARIYKPAKTAMQSGHGNTKRWVLDFEGASPREIEPLMGWTSSADTLGSQVRMYFESKDAAVAFANRNDIPHEVQTTESESAPRKGKSYSDNFAFRRKETWTH